MKHLRWLIKSQKKRRLISHAYSSIIGTYIACRPIPAWSPDSHHHQSMLRKRKTSRKTANLISSHHLTVRSTILDASCSAVLARLPIVPTLSFLNKKKEKKKESKKKKTCSSFSAVPFMLRATRSRRKSSSVKKKMMALHMPVVFWWQPSAKTPTPFPQRKRILTFPGPGAPITKLGSLATV